MDSLEVIKSFEKILNWAGERNKIQLNYGTDVNLCMSEIHIVSMIGDNPGITQMQLCEKMGLTKGRISVIVSSLVKKQLITKGISDKSRKEVPLYLNNMGMTAYNNHKQKDNRIYNKMKTIMSQYSETEIEHFDEAIKLILETLKDSMQ